MFALLVYLSGALSHEAKQQARSHRSHNGDTEQKIAYSRIDCDLSSAGQRRIQQSIIAKGQGRNDPP